MTSTAGMETERQRDTTAERVGHEAVEAEHVVAERDGYWVVRKNPGLPAEIARATAPDA